MSTVSIQQIGITELSVDVIVNAANEGLQAGGGVCGAIFKAAGRNLLQKACNLIGHCDTGSAVITDGFSSNAKYIIHAVGPRYFDGKHGEDKLLYSAYQKSLELAVSYGCHSIGFPLISSGIFGYPVEQAWKKALQACRDYFEEHPNVSLNVIFAVLNDDTLKLGKKILTQIMPGMKAAERGDWKTTDLPARHDSFFIQRNFTEAQMQNLRHGNIPEAMEDKWFWYMEDNTLFAHRSWTGFCIFIIEFSTLGKHRVLVNRDPEQYKCTSVEEDIELVNDLLNWWSRPTYDYYHQWLSETVTSMKKQGLIKDYLTIGEQELEAIFFHKPEEPYGYLSNWYPSRFTIDEVCFTSAEQYIMYQKCLIFGDLASAQKVLATNDPQEQQTIGRAANGYVEAVWAGMRQLVAARALHAKFSQNDKLRDKLLLTGDAILVECAKSDKVWACGVGLYDTDRFNAGLWRGQNLLGFALMEIRNIFKQTEKQEQ